MKYLLSVFIFFSFQSAALADVGLSIKLDQFNMGLGFPFAEKINLGYSTVNLSTSDVYLELANDQCPNGEHCRIKPQVIYNNNFNIKAEMHSNDCNVVGHYATASNGDVLYIVDASQTTCKRKNESDYKLRLVTKDVLGNEVQSVMYGNSPY